MQPFKNILLVAEGKPAERTALKRAVSLAKMNHAQLTVFSVVKSLPRDVQILITAVPPGELQALAIEKHREHIEQFIAPLQNEGASVAVKVVAGSPFIQIIRDVLRHNRDLVMITAEERKSRLKELLFGSTSMHLMRKCPCPVWVVKPGDGKHYARILAAVDIGIENRQTAELADRIVGLAILLARRERSRLHIVHTWDVWSEGFVRERAGIPRAEVEELMLGIRRMHESGLRDLLKKHDLRRVPHRVHILKGDPGMIIPKIAERERVGLIVMGTVGRTGIGGLLIGNTAEKVLRQINCSVLTAKPEGFVTPVTLDEQPD